MCTRANRKMFSFPDGVKIKPLYDKCPSCGYDLNQMPDAFVDKIKPDNAENSAGKTEASPESRTKKTLSPNLFKLCIAWMVLPFTAAKKNATKRDKKRFIGWKFRK